jgi:hypothetical protein
MTSEITRAVTPVVDAFERLGIEYLVGGSVASSARGLARTTVDIDLVARLPMSKVAALVERLEPGYYADAEMIRDAIRQQASFNLIHLETMLKIDVYILRPRPFDLQSFERRRPDSFDLHEGARQFQIEAPEDVVLHKLEWYRLGGGVADRHWTDVLGVLKVQRATIDVVYLKKWACEIGVEDLLLRALADAGIEPTR